MCSAHSQPQLRETIRSFCEKELAPYADEIDRNNEFPGYRVGCYDINSTAITILLLRMNVNGEDV